MPDWDNNSLVAGFGKEKNLSMRFQNHSAAQSDRTNMGTAQHKAADYSRLAREVQRIADDFTRRQHIMENACVTRIEKAVAQLALDLLPIADDLGALTGPKGNSLSQDALVQALTALEAKFLNIFQRHEIRPIDAKVGDLFNYHVHDALYVVESKELESDRLAHILERGFWLRDRVLRPVRVAVTVRPGEGKAN